MNIKTRTALAALAILLLSSIDTPAPARASDQTLPATFVVASTDAIAVPAPPDGAATLAELGELKKIVAERTSLSAERAAYWATGGSPYRWNAIAADKMIERGIPTPIAARHMVLIHAAVHDAIALASDRKVRYGRPRPTSLDSTIKTAVATPPTASYPSEHAAAAGAASEVLAYLFPDAAQNFRAMAEEAGRSRSLAGLAFPSDVAAGLGLGRAVGAQAIERGKSDGSDAKWSGAVPTHAGAWNGTNPILPLAGTWKTWLITSPDALRPPPPPAHDSAQKKAELAELKAVKRTPAMTSHSWFWEWGAGGFRAWHLWNEQTSRKILEHGLAEKPLDAARVFALTSMAVHDAVVACWDAKYAYWAIRPSQLDPELKALFPPPNHPSYPAAHACISTAAGHTLAGLFPREAEALHALATQAADARIWAGIHYRSDVEAGRVIGEAVARHALALTSAPPVR